MLHGTQTEQYLSLVNGSQLSVNGKKYPDTRVLVDAYSIAGRAGLIGDKKGRSRGCALVVWSAGLAHPNGDDIVVEVAQRRSARTGAGGHVRGERRRTRGAPGRRQGAQRPQSYS